MKTKTDRDQPGSGLSTGSKKAGPVEARATGNAELNDALELERSQQALLEAAPVEQLYQETLQEYVQAKQLQVGQIEDRIEKQIEKQQSQLQQIRSNQPGMFARSSTKNAWQNQQAQQQARLNTLHDRLEVVREIKDGMGIHSPKIEELATRKMRANEPEMTTEFDEMQEAQRHHQALLRKQEQEKKQRLAREDEAQDVALRALGRGQRLHMSQGR